MDPEADMAMRRRSPGWLREFDDGALHGLALRLRRKFWEGESSSKEDWLLDVCISELEYRHRAAIRRPGTHACTCEMCLGPFPMQESFDV